MTDPDSMVTVEIKWFPAPSHALYQVGRGDDDLYYACRDTTPMFCFSGTYQEDAEEQAGRAIESYFRLAQSRPDPGVREALEERIIDFARSAYVQGYGDGAAGFFRDNNLQIVPGTERAWCQERDRGVLKPGCYVEWFYHQRGYNQRTWDGEPCGYLARWYRPPGTKAYAPTAGSPFAAVIARADMSALMLEETSWMPAHLKDVRRLDWCTTKAPRR